MINTSIFLIAFLGTIVFILKGIVKVEDNEQAVIERFGRFNRMLKPGVHFIMPVAERLRGIEDPYNHKRFLNSKKISLSPEIMPFPKDDRTFFANNNEQFKIKCNVLYQITDPYKAVYEVAFLFDALNQLVAGIIQKRLIENQEQISELEKIKNIFSQLLETANEYSKNWGVLIKEFQLKQIIDSNGIRHNIEE